MASSLVTLCEGHEYSDNDYVEEDDDDDNNNNNNMGKVKVTPNMPLGTQRGSRGIALPKPDLNAKWVKISRGNHRREKKITRT